MNSKKVIPQKFVDKLKEEIKIYEKLLGIVKEKQQKIIQGEIEDLRSLVDEENKCVQEAKKIADQRNFIITQLENNWEDGNDFEFDRMIEQCGPKLSAKLKNFRHRLREIMNRINYINSENKVLLDFSLDHVQGLANLFLTLDEKENNKVYDNKGSMKSQKNENKMLDFQI